MVSQAVLDMARERAVKRNVSAYLDRLTRCYYRMHVPGGFGRQGIDYEGCIAGRFFGIETKAPGEWLTPRQRDTCLEILASGGAVFVISSAEGLRSFQRWVDRCCKV